MVATVVASGGCRGGDPAIAELVRADGPVERQVAEAPWQAAAVGAKFGRGDAARTAAGGAQLAIANGAQIAMQPHTILRFGGAAASGKIAVELGAIDLTGSGSYGFDIGDVRLSRNGSVRITAQGGVELAIGEAQLSNAAGTVELEVGRQLQLGDAVLAAVPVDAGVPVDAAPPPPDAPASVAPAPPVIELALRGRRGELRAPGATRWTAIAAGVRALPPGAALRLGPRTTGDVTAGATTLALAAGARLMVSDDGTLVLEAGTARATSAGDGGVQLPGGAIVLRGTPEVTAEVGVEVGRDVRIAVQRGSARLSGAPGKLLDLTRGEIALLTRTGTLRALEAIPTTFDFRVAPGESLTIHDPRPPSVVQFQLGARCTSGGIVEVDRDARFRSPRVSAGREVANLRLDAGAWAYRVRCTSGGDEGAAVATGRIVVVKDGGTRALPTLRPPNDIEVDGRTWRVSYQSAMPDLLVRAPPGGRSYRLHVAQGGSEEVFDAARPQIAIPGARLREGSYTYWVDIDGAKHNVVSTLIINFDQTAAQVYLESPADGAVWQSEIEVRGAVLPGWTAEIDSIAIPIDRQRRFAAKVNPPAGTALAIRLAHPQRGVHYYLRRAK